MSGSGLGVSAITGSGPIRVPLGFEDINCIVISSALRPIRPSSARTHRRADGGPSSVERPSTHHPRVGSEAWNFVGPTAFDNLSPGAGEAAARVRVVDANPEQGYRTPPVPAAFRSRPDGKPERWGRLCRGRTRSGDRRSFRPRSRIGHAHRALSPLSRYMEYRAAEYQGGQTAIVDARPGRRRSAARDADAQAP